ncbi:MAG: tRNA-dihydrouridine synthase [Patescibacteria group bacterium]
MNFWEKLPKPFFVLAPMEDVTDVAFRTLIAKYSAPEVPRAFYTEFTSADGLILAPLESKASNGAGRRKLFKKLEFSENERPVVAQLFTSNLEHMEAAAKMCRELGFDGFDINMGCPVNEVVRQNCGAALIKDPAHARALIRAAKRGFEGPVSVKTRIGYNTDELETWLPELLAEELAAVVLHARTRKEMSEVPARWERVARAVEIRDALKSPTLILGNGDVRDIADARAKCEATGADGAMLGRAVFGNPWLFAEANNPERSRGTISPEEKIRALIEHIELFQQMMSGYQNDAVMKRHFKAYIGGWDGAKELRTRLMDTAGLEEATEVLRETLVHL